MKCIKLNNMLVIVMAASMALPAHANLGSWFKALASLDKNKAKRVLCIGCTAGACIYALAKVPAAQKKIRVLKRWVQQLKPHVQQDVAACVGVAETQGRRKTMEDAYVIDRKADFALYGVFDGHGGRKVADFAAQNLPTVLRHSYAKIGNTDTALRQSFLEIHKQLGDAHGAQTQGCTAVVALVKDGKITVANAGDSRAVLARDGKAFALSDDHKPHRPDEKARIENLGGKVVHYGVPRVQGDLAVSRALGDKALNPYVTPEPEIMRTILTTKDEFLILACDGVWDVMNNQQAVDIVKDAFAQKQTATQASAILRNMAFKRGSQDNITAMVVRLTPVQ